MLKKNDWRLTNQENYLKNEVFMLSQYTPQKKNNDHDHCEFCLSKFSTDDNGLHFGYCTLNKYRWICPKCFEDFKEMFNFELVTNEEE